MLSLEIRLACSKASTSKAIPWFKSSKVYQGLERSTVLLVAWQQRSATKPTLRKAPWYAVSTVRDFPSDGGFPICKWSVKSAREAGLPTQGLPDGLTRGNRADKRLRYQGHTVLPVHHTADRRHHISGRRRIRPLHLHVLVCHHLRGDPRAMHVHRPGSHHSKRRGPAPQCRDVVAAHWLQRSLNQGSQQRQGRAGAALPPTATPHPPPLCLEPYPCQSASLCDPLGWQCRRCRCPQSRPL